MTDSPFSNPAAGAADAGAAYTRALLGMLGDREPLAVLEELVPFVEARLTGGAGPAPGTERLARPEAPGKWSALDLLRHLVDTEFIHLYRTRTVLEQQHPPIRGYDQDAWVRLFAPSVPSAAEGLELLRVVRTANLRLWRTLTPAELARTGVHAERGEESVAHMLRLLAGHDLVHRRQLDRILG